MYDTYTRIFTRLGLKFRAVAADTGAIGGTGSHEFHVLADSGEDAIAYCPESDYAANVELAEALAPCGAAAGADASAAEGRTRPGVKTIAELCAFLKMPPAEDGQDAGGATAATAAGAAAAARRPRAERDQGGKARAARRRLSRFAADAEIRAAVRRRTRLDRAGRLQAASVIADRARRGHERLRLRRQRGRLSLTPASTSAATSPSRAVADIRNVVAGDPSPDGKGTLEICRGIEVGHIFQLRTKYSEAMKATFLDESGQAAAVGDGLLRHRRHRASSPPRSSRTTTSAASSCRAPIAPFQVALVPIGYGKSAEVRETADTLYRELTAAGFEVLLDDRDERPGVMFADMELIGIPHRIVVGERGLKDGPDRIPGPARRKAQPSPCKTQSTHTIKRCALRARP